MANLQGFWSYVHADDKAENGRISQLAKDIVSQFEMYTGEEISLFLDKESLEWGKNWRNEIDRNLVSTGFFIPILTPRYFMSAECRRELQSFARKAIDLGIKDLILPIIYVETPSMNDEYTTDDLIQLVKTFQWENWTELRFEDVNSENYRRGVARLANRIVEANKRAEETLAVSTPKNNATPSKAKDLDSQNDGDEEDESLGLIDLLADTEEQMEKSPSTLAAIAEEVVLIGDIMRKATLDINKPIALKSGFAHKQVIARRIAVLLDKPIEKIWKLSNELSSQQHSVDKGYRVIIERASEEITNNPASKENFCTFFDSIKNLIETSTNAFANIKKMSEATEPLDKISRDLRPVMRRLRQGLTIMLELEKMYQEWLVLIETTGISCQDVDVKGGLE